MAAIARRFLQLRDVKRDLYLFDTFEGMSQPASKDIGYMGRQASDVLAEELRFKCGDPPLERVKKVLYDTGYPNEKIHFVQGKVEETGPASAPDSISSLRLDTDCYESTKHQLVHLFPRLAHSGVIIIDDHGHWEGSRQACDEYFSQNNIGVLLNRIDFGGRIASKP